MPTDCKHSYSGIALRVGKPTPAMVNLADIAMSIAGIYRFDGATHTLWPVSSHSWLVGQITDRLTPAPTIGVDARLHDCQEYAFGDITTPAKAAFEDRLPGFRDMLHWLAADWDVVIYKAMKLPLVPPIMRTSQSAAEIVKVADTTAMYIEKHLFMKVQWGVDTSAIEPYAHLFEDCKELAKLNRKQSALYWLLDLRRALIRVNPNLAAIGICNTAIREINS